jgi:murein DD-endopeptidase MepM/ murein hydrolase activator NlpD
MANEPVNTGGTIRPKVYYHSGLDFDGAPRMVEVVAAADGLVAGRGKDILPGYEDTPVYRLKPRDDVVYVFDARGWSYRYSHLYSIDPGVRTGRTVKMGQKIGVLGHRSGGRSHLHFEIKCIQPSGMWGTQAGYAFVWEAYLRQYSPQLVAIARPPNLAWPGETVVLDGSRSWTAKGKITDYKWIFDDGSSVSGAKIERTYDRPGCYCEILQITNSDGKVDYDFAYTRVVDRASPKQFPPHIHPTYFPTFGIKPGDPVTFKVRSFNLTEGQESWHYGLTEGQETWDFGDASPLARTQSGEEASIRTVDGYAATVHRYAKPGHYLVRVERSDEDGRQAIARLHVRVGNESVLTRNSVGSTRD